MKINPTDSTRKPFLAAFTLLAVLACAAPGLRAQMAAATPAPAAAPAHSHAYEKHVQPILNALHLGDAVQAEKVGAVIAAQLDTLDAWHHGNDAQIKELWDEFDHARAKHDEAGADTALAKIDAVYAGFKPQHDAFLAALGAQLTPAQVTKVEDKLTINKTEVTYHAYQQIFPGLTDAQKAFILQNLELARNQAIDAGSMKEKSAFYKKYKIRIEAYLTAQGYNVKESYRVFIAKQKAEKAAKKAAGE